MTLTQAAAFLEINSHTLRKELERGKIEADHPFPAGPWVLNRKILESEAATKLAERVHRPAHTTAIPSPDQPALDLSDT